MVKCKALCAIVKKILCYLSILEMQLGKLWLVYWRTLNLMLLFAKTTSWLATLILNKIWVAWLQNSL